MITRAQIKKFAPKAKPEIVQAILDNWYYAEANGINTRARVIAFFGEIATESAGLTKTAESMAYSAPRLVQVFGTRNGLTPAKAAALVKQGQKAIANFVYGGAWGKKNLGNTEPNDGWDMRGGGLMQTTGRTNYRKMGFEDNPEALREPATAFRTAVREWANRNCNTFVDRKDYRGLRKVINGGTNGLADAQTWRGAATFAFEDYVPGKAKTPATRAPVPVLDLSSQEPADVIAVEEARTAPEPGAIPTLPDFVVNALKTEMKAKGYYEFGNIEPEWGGRSIAGMTAFQFDNGLPRSGLPDKETMDWINTHGVPERKIAPERANATVASLKEAGTLPPAAEAAGKSKFWGAVQGFGALISAAIIGIADQLGVAWDMVSDYKAEILSYGVPALLGAVTILAGFQYYQANRAEKKAIDAVRSGADTA